MRTAPPPLLPLLRSQVQGELLALLFLHPDEEFSLTDGARRIGASVRAVHAEAGRLSEAGLLKERREGNVRLLRAATDSLLARPLTDLLAVTYGPLPLLAEALGAVDGVARAFIYGSWAARYHGETGAVPNDIDVLVVGTADLDVLHDCAAAVEQRVGRPVQIHRVSPRAWGQADTESGFLGFLRGRPLVEIPLEGARGHGQDDG